MSSAGFVEALVERRRPSRAVSDVVGGVAFCVLWSDVHGRFQDPGTSREWQRAVAEELIDGFGRVTVKFFDVGRLRRWSWSERESASALLAAAVEPDRQFDAVVVGEYERAFHGDQFWDVVRRLHELGVQVWLSEAGGPVELDSPVHQALMLLGAQAQREVARARRRALAAMAVQTREQGRYLGGRPPYGYMLVDGAAHPNREQAGWGRRVKVLVPDPQAAQWVGWMFTKRSVASLVRELNERGAPCPSANDPGPERPPIGRPVGSADRARDPE